MRITRSNDVYAWWPSRNPHKKQDGDTAWVCIEEGGQIVSPPSVKDLLVRARKRRGYACPCGLACSCDGFGNYLKRDGRRVLESFEVQLEFQGLRAHENEPFSWRDPRDYDTRDLAQEKAVTIRYDVPYVDGLSYRSLFGRLLFLRLTVWLIVRAFVQVTLELCGNPSIIS